MQRKKFSREFKLEAVNLVRGSGVFQLPRQPGTWNSNVNMLRRWAKELALIPRMLSQALGK